MEFPVGLGGVTLVIVAVIWLLVFVPGFTKRSQITETSKYVLQQQRLSDQKIPMTKAEQLQRLIRTQRVFSVIFGLLFLGSAGLWIAEPHRHSLGIFGSGPHPRGSSRAVGLQGRSKERPESCRCHAR